jgi:hypothetical protein
VKRALRGMAVPAVAAVLALVGQGAASAAVVADWEMNETTKTNGMVDEIHGYVGDIGNEVRINQSTGDGGQAYQFPGPHFAPYNPEKLVLVPDDPDGAGPATDSALDPGTGPYAVTIRFRTTADKPNIVQKGQNNVRGGFMKLVLKSGWPRCHFEDGQQHISAIGFVGTSVPKVDDGRWHTLRCEETTTGVRVTLDAGTANEATKFKSGTVGNINNSRPFMIGGKLDCNRDGVTCDFFAGQLDWVKIEKG